MENKINIAEILKDCPKGMELDCTMYDNVVFDGVSDDTSYPIDVLSDTMKLNLTKTGGYSNSPDAKCVIFPKGKTTWEGFQRPFKGGDIVISAFGDIHLLSTEDSSYCSYRKRWRGLPKFDETITTSIKVERLATEEEKNILFNAIKVNGYKWNTETKTLERLAEPRFKVGDRIKAICNNIQFDIKELTDTHYTLEEVNYKFKYTELIREDKNWELVSNKFDINTLKPFDKVLVRCSSLEKWHIQFFEKYNTDSSTKFPFICLCYNKYSQCIPYENNQHLLDTANDCNDFYKTWE